MTLQHTLADPQIDLGEIIASDFGGDVAAFVRALRDLGKPSPAVRAVRKRELAVEMVAELRR